MLFGIDLSHHNGVNGDDAIKKLPDFVAIKVSEGKSWRDNRASKYAALCTGLNIPLICYHYCRPEINNNAGVEVNNFILAVNDACPVNTKTAFMIDWEGNAPGHEQWLNDFVRILYDNTGCYPIVYCSQSLVKQVGWHVDTKHVGLWVAHWGKASGQPGDVNPFPFWAFHQYGAKDGIDQDVFNGSEEKLLKYLNYEVGYDESDWEPEDKGCCHCCSCGG